MMEFILWVIFTKIVSQVVIIKKIVITEKNCNNWKRSWSLKKIAIIGKNCNNWKRLWLLKKIVIIEKYCDNSKN